MASERKDIDVLSMNANSLLMGVLNSSHDGIMAFAPLHDASGAIIDFVWTVVNPAAEAIVGRTSDDLVGKQLLIEMPGNAESGLFDRYVDVVMSGNAFVEQHHYDHEGLDKWFQTTAVCLDDGFAVTFRDVTDTKQMQLALEYQAGHDPLTGLANRALLENRIEHSLAGLIRSPSTLTLLFLDLDRFKVINDGLGHEFGDAMLVQFADRVISCIRPTDTMARLGGDEFVILLDDIEPDDLDQVTDRILATATKPYCIADRDVFLAVTIGVAHTVTSDTTPSRLIAEADQAMSQAKELGGNRVGVAIASTTHSPADRLDLEVQLHRALDLDQLRLAYQPVVDCRTGVIDGAEALIRWEHPTRGMVRPDQFLPIAEATGLIRPIGDWVLREAIRQLAAWSATIEGAERLTMSVNASADQLTDSDFPEKIATSLALHGVAPERLCVEVTETSLIRDPAAARSTLNEISWLGASIALDDFGTGYSPLTYLQQFPVDTIKIDRSFISQSETTPEDAELVAAVINFATALDKTVTAEGIETVEQLERIRSAHHYQGYLFSRPVWADEFAELLTAEHAATPTSVSVCDGARSPAKSPTSEKRHQKERRTNEHDGAPGR
ncbi:MAG: putative bifunctional diguanylate cyclase/phosphodiesterase [Ilumatobacter sp.]